MKILETRKQRAVDALKVSSKDVTIDWESAAYENQTQVVQCICNTCNTPTKRAVKHLVNGKFSCAGCQAEKYRKYAAEVGWKYQGHGCNSIDATCSTCGTHSVIPSGTLLRGLTPRCSVCLDKKYTTAADNLGFDYVARAPQRISSTATRLFIKCRKDGYVYNIAASEVLAGCVSCPECQINTYRTSLAEKNCTFVKLESKFNGSINKSRVSYKNESGELFEATTGNILAGKFTNSTSGEWYSNHSTYLIITNYSNNIYCKIGTARHPETRMIHLQLSGESVVFTLYSFEDRFGADQLESELHKEFKNFKLERAIAEEFTTATKKVKRVGQTERVSIKDGSTEWFTHEVYDILKTRYNLTEGSANGS